ncbi:helix-turn-helix domain-containing protein [Salipaludibacillus daqingensis]|uniref:helix-turn-helix domain-containing protein n=1 Tax=Salipaludibacillus daqingensis TaxID=3041001 RepID=UPI00247607C2|nr:helix-turn-helix domain-containing protein [Salipaludibacillus daqingensis]
MKRDWLINLRKNKNLTQQQVASIAYIDRGFYAQIENGLRDPSIPVAKKIARALSFNAAAFFAELADPFYTALNNSSIIIAHFDLDLRYTWIFYPHSDFNNSDILGKKDTEIKNNSGTIELMKLKSDVIKDGVLIRRNITFPLSNGELYTYDVCGAPIKEDGTIIGGTTVSTDISHLV